MTHTPGPWSRGGDGADIFGPGTPPSFEDSRHIADCQPERPGLLGMEDEDLANARIMALAPEMLQLCMAIVVRFQNKANLTIGEKWLLKDVRAVIAKAEGSK